MADQKQCCHLAAFQTELDGWGRSGSLLDMVQGQHVDMTQQELGMHCTDPKGKYPHSQSNSRGWHFEGGSVKAQSS